jgi:hypothetical protein
MPAAIAGALHAAIIATRTGRSCMESAARDESEIGKTVDE